jgi:hypothetical protein
VIDVASGAVQTLDASGSRAWTDNGAGLLAGDVTRLDLASGSRLRRGAGREEVLSRVRAGYVKADERYDEAGHTAVRDAVADDLDKWLVAAGFEPIEAFDEITC